MNLSDFSDPIVDRQLSFQIARKGCGLHHERFLCFFDMEQSENLSPQSTSLFLELAKIHYEVDFLAGTSAEINHVQRGTTDDNCYLIDSLTEEQRAYLHFKSRIVVTNSDIVNRGIESIKTAVIESLKHDRFKRDDTTKVAYFKINHSVTATNSSSAK